MNYTIGNEKLTVVVSDRGAELQSIKSADGTEYLWQADPEVWDGKAPNIFPYVARLTEGTYTLNGTAYQMQIHGLVDYMTLDVEKQSQTSITFRLDGTEEVKKSYPFDFSYRITYTVDENVLLTTVTVDNHGDERMYFAVGGHPGINVPLDKELKFEDYYLEFDQPTHPTRVGFTERCFLSGKDELFELEANKRLALTHSLFDQDAIVLKHAARSVAIRSEKGTKCVIAKYPDFPYIGFWHMPHTEAQYVCIEPWSSLPSRDGIVEEFSQQSDLIHLAGKETFEITWTLEIRE